MRSGNFATREREARPIPHACRTPTTKIGRRCAVPIPREKKQCAAAAGAHLGTKSTYLLLLAMEEESCESLIFEATPPPKGAGMSLVARALELAARALELVELEIIKQAARK